MTREQALVDFALANSPYGNNGRAGFATIENERVCEGVSKLSDICAKNNYNYFNIFVCSRFYTCPFEARIPKNTTLTRCPAIFFGKHTHQLVKYFKFNNFNHCFSTKRNFTILTLACCMNWNVCRLLFCFCKRKELTQLICLMKTICCLRLK